MCLFLSFIAFCLVALRVMDYGLTWDEPAYFHFARLQREWWGGVLSGIFSPSSWGGLFSKETIARVWLQHRDWNGHPPLHEVWMGLAGAPFHWFGLPDMQAFRLAMALLFAATSGLLYLLLRLALPRTASAAGAVCYWGIPAIWAHAHIGATETMQNFFWVAEALLLPLALSRRRRWMLLWLLVAAFAFMAKFTNLLIPFWVLGTAGILGALRRRRFWAAAFLAVGTAPLLLLLLDPFFWPWQGGTARFLDYLQQTTTRSQWVPISVFYLGKNWGFHPPWHYRPVELLTALPLPLFLLFIPGLAAALRALPGDLRESWRRAPRGTHDQAQEPATVPDPSAASRPRGAVPDPAVWPRVLALTGLAFTFVIGWLPGTPNHDGTRQFVYAFIPVAILSAIGFEAARCFIAARFSPGSARTARVSLVLLFVPAIAAFGISLGFEPWGLSYFSEWIGGTRGAFARGFEVSYWSETVDRKMLQALGEVPQKDPSVLRVHTLPKLNYFAALGDFADPVLPPKLRGRVPPAEDVMSAFYVPWARAQRKEERGPLLGLSFNARADAVILCYRRASISDGMWDFFAYLAERGDLTLVHETRVGGVPLARLFAVNELRPVRLPEDPDGKIWYQPPSVAGPASRQP